MTVTYTHEVANARLGGFSRLLLRWTGSVYKLLYKEFTIYIVLYILLSVCYRCILDPDFRKYFEKLCLQFHSYTDLVPISFVLGFYVSMVVGRWWQMYMYIPWPDRLMVIIASNVHGPDYRGRLIRRTLMRYLSLMEVLTYRSISTAVFKRFPTMEHVIDAGFMTLGEYKQYENVTTDNVKYFVPCVWFANLLSKVRQEGRIYDDITYQAILKELNNFRGSCGMLVSYDWISIPLVYTQVVTVAVYVYFMSTLLSRQYLDVTKGYAGHEVDLFVPIFTIFQFLFYVGWLKVAEQLINPFGEDDDDFEVNFIIDRNLELSMLTVDSMYLSHPKLERDIYWNNPNPSIPYTAASANHKVDAFLGSTVDMRVNREKMQFLESPPPLSGLVVDHNKQNFPYEPPPSNISTRQAPSHASNSLALFTGRDKDNDMKNLVVENESSIIGYFEGGENDEEKYKIIPESDECTLIPEPDDDSGNSDVGDSGRSADGGSDDNKSSRTSSILSLEEDKDTFRKSSVFQKYSIVEPKHQTGTKNTKNSIVGNAAAVDGRPDKFYKKAGERRNTNYALARNFSEGNLINMPGRFSLGKGKKSPKKKTNIPKLSKRNDFQQLNGEETEEERRNAQMRTRGLLKATKRKSVQALQRNTRRANYPGNAWLRHKHPSRWRSVVTSATDYKSMTSGADDQMEHDSPFGSVTSFATSVPSPRPLRFSQFGKRWRRKQFDSVSGSSCMTSPCANDDFSPYSDFFNALPKPREEHNPTRPVNMPFTEDLRRRLLAPAPTSPTATSPLSVRAFPTHVGYHQPISSASGLNPDDLLVTTSAGRATGWKNLLEKISEVTPSGKVSERPKESKSNSNTNSAIPPIEREKMSLNLERRRTLSCPGVSTLRIDNMTNGKFNTSNKEPISDIVAPVKEKPVEICPEEKGLEMWNARKQDSPDKRPGSFHCEDGVSPRKSVTTTCFDTVPAQVIRASKTAYTNLTQYSCSELTPLLQQDEAASTEKTLDLELENKKSSPTYQLKTAVADSSFTHESPAFGCKDRASDTRYCGEKEDSKNALAEEDPLLKVPSISICQPNKHVLGTSLSEKHSQIREEIAKQVSFEPLEEVRQELKDDLFPDSVVIAMPSSNDDIIEIT